MELTDYQKSLFKEWVKNLWCIKMGKKTTVCHLVLQNGFEVVGTSACVNPDDFDTAIGEHYALVNALNKVDELAGFYRQATTGK